MPNKRAIRPVCIYFMPANKMAVLLACKLLVGWILIEFGANASNT